MKKEQEFGIVITTFNGCYHMTLGLLASIEYFAPELPICLIIDGELEIEKEIRTYNITHVIKKSDVIDDFLKDTCFGSRLSNMVAFWQSPFHKFLYLDSDTVLWGNITQSIKKGFDFVHNEPHEAYTDQIYKTQYCDFEKLFEVMPSFEFRTCNFFNAGVFYSKRGIIDINTFKRLMEIWDVLNLTDLGKPQGMINYMVFTKSKNNHIKMSEQHLQTVVPVKSKSELKAMFRISKGIPVITKDTVIHWAGVKPLLMHRKETFIKPMLFFRKQHLKNIKSIWRFLPIPYLLWEEFQVVLKRYHQGSVLLYLKRKVKKVLTN